MRRFAELAAVAALCFAFGCAKPLEEKQVFTKKGVVYTKEKGKAYTGKVVAWHENKKMKSECSYKKGKLSGTSKFWYDNGKPEAVRHYQDGKLHGKSEEWFESGSQKKVEEYLEGKRHGEWQTWKEDGKPEQAGICAKGKDMEVFDFFTDGSKHLKYRDPSYKTE